MIILEILGWALISGCAVALFCAPIYLMGRLLSKSNDEK